LVRFEIFLQKIPLGVFLKTDLSVGLVLPNPFRGSTKQHVPQLIANWKQEQQYAIGSLTYCLFVSPKNSSKYKQVCCSD